MDCYGIFLSLTKMSDVLMKVEKCFFCFDLPQLNAADYQYQHLFGVLSFFLIAKYGVDKKSNISRFKQEKNLKI